MMNKRSGLLMICLVAGLTAFTQSLSGTWIAAYVRDEPGNKRIFYYRFYLKGSADSVYGVAEALSADTDIQLKEPDEALVINRFRVNRCGEASGSEAIILCTGAPLYMYPNPSFSQQAPLFLQFHLKAVNELPTQNAGPIISLLPFNDGTTARVDAQKISDTAPEFAFEWEGKHKAAKKIALPRLVLPFKKKGLVRDTTTVRTVRTEDVQHQLEVTNTEASIAVYDNGIVDDDTVSLYLNDILLIKEQKVSSHPLHLNITLQKGKENKLVLYAHNLGRLPPNTALMILTVGGKRHELRLASSLSKNATAVITVKD